MPFARSVFVVSGILLTQLLFGCSSPADNANALNTTAANAPNTSTTTAKDNVEEFADIVRLPFAPDEVAWNEKAGKELTAVIRFSPENATKMATEAAKNGQPAAETLTVETWYPAELIAQSEMTGESTIKGQSWPAEPFLNPPYTKGKITRIEGTDYFILQISS